MKVKCLFCGKVEEMDIESSYKFDGFCNKTCEESYKNVIEKSRKREKARLEEQEKEEI